ncbi:MAG: PQQ-binding-like beta-propeller repeat protein [Phycisphaerales bacterium]
MRRDRHAFIAGFVVSALLSALPIAARTARAQESTPVTVGDSPAAFQLFQQVLDQARDNPSEAARLSQRLLDGFADRVIPADDPPGPRFESVLTRVERFLREHPAALERYRQLESAEAERLFALGELDLVARTRALTPAGLRGQLTLAERELHAANFDRAIARLARIEGHPDLGEGSSTSVYWFLRGAAAALESNTGEREEAIARLKALATPEALAAVEAIARLAALEPAQVPLVSTPLSVGAEPEALEPGAERSWQPIWSIDMPGSAFARAFLGSPVDTRPEFQLGAGNVFGNDLSAPMLPREFDRARYDGSMLTIAPAVGGETVIVSDGLAVTALDRLSHRTVWKRPIGIDTLVTTLDFSDDLAAVATSDDCVVACGVVEATVERTPTGAVTCIDRATGAPRWETLLVTPTRAEPAGANGGAGAAPEPLFAAGEPVIDGGSVFVLARKTTAQLETVEYLFAIDLANGDVRWATFVCSSGGMPRRSGRPASRPVVADGSVFVASSVGAVARIDADDGRVRWAYRFLVPMRDLRYPCEPWEMGAPAVVGESVFAIAPDQSEVVQLEKGTGRLVQSFPTGPTTVWGTPRYLLVDDGAQIRPPRIYAVGADVVAIDPESPHRAQWTMSKANESAFANREGIANRSGMRGRVQIAGDVLVVPGLRDVLLVSRDTGRVKERIEVDGPANPVLVGPLLLVGQNATLTALMPTQSAERVMRERIASLPNDPEGGLALVDLGLRTQRLDLCADGARAARDALVATNADADAPARSELVERLTRTMRLDDAHGDGGDAVLTIMADVAVSPAHRVRSLLSRAAWLAGRGRANDAISALEEILARPELATILVDDGAWTIRPASAMAIERLTTVARSAPTAFAARESAARAQLSNAGDDPSRLEAILASASGTDAAEVAASRLAKSLEAAGRPQAALGAIMRAIRDMPDGGNGAAALVADALALCDRQAWSRYAHELADCLAARFPGAVKSRTSDGSSSDDRAFRIGPVPKDGVEIPGRIVRMAMTGESRARLDGTLAIAERQLSLIDARTLQPRWTVTVDDRDPVALAVGEGLDDSVLLWQERADGGRFATTVSLRDGSIRDTTPLLSEVLPPDATLSAGRPVLQVMPNGDHFDPGELLPFVAGRTLVVVRRNGDVAGFDLRDLSRPAWTVRGVLSQVYSVAASDLVVALAGREAGEGDDREPGVATLDPAKGTVLLRYTLAADDVRWLRLAPTGELLIGSGEGIEAHDALLSFGDVGERSSLLWKNRAPAVRDTASGWRFGSWVVAADRAETLSALELRDGRLDESRFRPPPRAVGRSGAIQWAGRVRNGVAFQFEDRIVVFAMDGSLLGEDALIDEGNFVFLLPIESGLLSVRSSGSRQVPYPLTGGMRTEFPYLVYRLSVAEGCRLLGPAMQVRLTGQRCDRIGAADGVVFFSTAGQTIAVPMPAE